MDAGWLSNSIAYYYGLDMTAIDFNSDVIEKAKGEKIYDETSSTYDIAGFMRFLSEELGEQLWKKRLRNCRKITDATCLEEIPEIQGKRQKTRISYL